MSALKLICLNIERSKHLDRVIPFLEREAPDVFCVQELCERDISQLGKVVGPCRAYAPVCLHVADPPETTAFIMGTGLFSRLPIRMKDVRYYRGSEDRARNSPAREIMDNIPLIVCDVEHKDATFRTMTTHFTWDHLGAAIEQQRIDIKSLSAILDASGEFVIAGDFNAPRGGEIFSILASKYKDNIPPEYRTSLDRDLHRAGKDRSHELADKMVDGLFTTREYRAADVRLQFGVSDHAAVVATISRM